MRAAPKGRWKVIESERKEFFAAVPVARAFPVPQRILSLCLFNETFLLLTYSLYRPFEHFPRSPLDEMHSMRFAFP